MIRIYLILLLVIMAFFGLRAFRKASPAVLAKYARILLLGIMGMAVLYLTATGRLNWFFALLGVAIAFMLRLMPAVLHYGPQLHRLWQEFSGAKQNSSQRQSDVSAKGKMSVEEAYEVLGLKPGASEQDIIAAHRKLMQKIHPDRGGSDYLAAKINLAKKILLKK
ncbi:MAG: DnaJ domain-containing protein [Methylococcaceae bacterium]|nr:DnaJ domain-containing protein [Methylococcaceae bacterium]